MTKQDEANNRRARLIVWKVNEQTNDYDAIDEVAKMLNGFGYEEVWRTPTINSNDPEAREKALLCKLYEIQENLADMLDKGVDDPHYVEFNSLVERLEKYIQNRMQII